MTNASPEEVIAASLAETSKSELKTVGGKAFFAPHARAILSALAAAGYEIVPKGATEIVRAIADVIMESDPPTLSVELPQALTLRIALYAASQK